MRICNHNSEKKCKNKTGTIDKSLPIEYTINNTLCTAYKSTVQTEQAMVYPGGRATQVATDERKVTSVGQ